MAHSIAKLVSLCNDFNGASYVDITLYCILSYQLE